MSTFGKYYRVTTFGESHCKAVGCIVDGMPPGVAVTEEDIQQQLSRRRPGQSSLTTPRDEKDSVEILSGTEKGVTLGTPIGMMVRNKDQRPHDYTDERLDAIPRPSHADFTYLEKYNVKASSGGGRSSARETIGRVAAGALAEKYLKEVLGIEIVAFVSSVGHVELPWFDAADEERPLKSEFMELLHTVTRERVDAEDVRCPDATIAEKMREVRTSLDSVYGLTFSANYGSQVKERFNRWYRDVRDSQLACWSGRAIV